MKIGTKRMLPTIVILIITIIISAIAYNNIMRDKENECWQILNDSANSVKKEINIRLWDNINILKLASDAMAKEDINSYKKIEGHIEDFQNKTIFSRIDILYPNGTIMLQNGKNADETMSFDEAVSKGEHISSRMYDSESGKEAIYYFVPVKRDNQTIAMLVGVIECSKLSDIFDTPIYDDSAVVCIVDSDDGNFIVDNWHNSLGSIYDIPNLKKNKKYEHVNFIDEIVKGKTGVTAFESNTNGANYYMFYTPVGSFNYELLILIQDNIAFSSLFKLKRVMFAIGIAEGILLIIYLLWNWYNINQLEKSRAETVKQLEISTTLIECVTELSSNNNIDEAIRNLIKIINKFFKAERTYIFEIDYENEAIHSTYEYNEIGMAKDTEDFKEVPLSAIEDWIYKFENEGIFYIDDIEKETKENEPIVYKILFNRKVKKLIAVPLIRDDKIIGFLGVNNPSYKPDEDRLLSSIQFFVTNSLISKYRQEKLRYLSYKDVLTNLYNRNKYISVMESYGGIMAKRVGIIYMDLNGLKRINDQEGHEAGDRFIKRAAEEILSVFPENSYRIGGDEFVVLLIGIDKDVFEEKLNTLKANAKEKNISISFGSVWLEECDNLEERFKDVDKLMYEDKRKFYQDNKLDRRRR